MLDGVEIVHMSGRVYDPVLGRFLSSDPFVQSEFGLSGLNRYAYVHNNPFSYTDPSGHFIPLFFAAVAQGAGATAFQVVAISVVTTAVQVGLQSGSFEAGIKAGVFAAISAGAAHTVGGIFTHSVKGFGHEFLRAVAHGAVQGGIAEAQGGSFDSAFVAGFASSAGGSIMESGAGQNIFDKEGKRVLMAAVVGGTASELSGGSFANEALTGAFVQMLNHDGARSKDEVRALRKANKAWNKFSKKYPTQAQEITDAARAAGVTFNVSLYWNANYNDLNSSMSGSSKIGGTYSSSSKEFNLNVDRSMKELVEAIRYEWTHLVDDIVNGMNITNTPRDVLEQRAYGPSYVPGQDLTPSDTIQRLNNQYPGSNWQKTIDRGPGGNFSIDDIIGGP